MQKKILIIDDDKFIVNSLTEIFENEFQLPVLQAFSYTQAKEIAENESNDILVCVVDLHLPDSQDGDAVTLTTSYKIPTIILTGSVDETLKKAQENQSVVEYILKNDINSFSYLTKVVNKIIENSKVNVLVVDDSKLQLNLVEKYLKLLNINVQKANDGLEALEIVMNQDISMVITDYEMPGLNGLKLTQEIRKKFHKDRLAIIAMSAVDTKEISIEFLKAGANDFLHKPFTFQELSIRVGNNLELLHLFRQNQAQKERLSELAFFDPLTKAGNRSRYSLVLKKYCKSYSARLKRNPTDKLSLIFIHINGLDDFNKKNGYNYGDKVLASFSQIINQQLEQSEHFFRIISVEFAILLPKSNLEKALEKCHKILSSLEKKFMKNTLKFSFGAVEYKENEQADLFSSRALRKMIEAKESEYLHIAYK